MADYQPTAEQAHAIDCFMGNRGDGYLGLIAYAGAGKTSTLRLMADATSDRGVYVAFNRSIVQEASTKFPESVRCSTAHGLAMRAVGQQYRHRLDSGRQPSQEVARHLGLSPFIIRYGTESKVLQPGWLAGHVLRAIKAFCNSADPEPSADHVPFVDGLDPDAEQPGRRWGPNQQALRDHLRPYLARAWADLSDPEGSLRYSHDCQPPGTLVRRVVRRGGHAGSAWEEVPIESVRVGDRVVSLTLNQRRGYLRRDGRAVAAAGQRDYRGDLITVTTGRGRRSSYTAEHRCVVRLDAELADGNHVVYLARRGADYRIGRTTWRTRSQGNALGVRRRLESQRADAAWILSVHETDAEAALAEALTAHRYRLPTWQFRSANETMPLAEFWSKVGNNRVAAGACLSAHGRDLRFPFWQRGDGWENTRRPVVLRALNLLSGMMVLEADEVRPGPKGELNAFGGAGGWAPARLTRSYYEGPVYSLDVETDHTYVADGIATHNCYLKSWELSGPRIDADYLLIDESQDLDPCVLSIMRQQEHAQQVYVGDPYQQIYTWRGAVDALDNLPAGAERAYLTQSFRFGPEVARAANLLLGLLEAPKPLAGHLPIGGRVGPTDRPDAVLYRTNAKAVQRLMVELAQGRRPHLVGGGGEVAAFARGALDLQHGGSTTYHELACFTSWGQVVEYVAQDPQGDELRLLVDLVEEHGAEKVLGAVEGMPREADADLVISTAHRAKGREWPAVQLGGDFKQPDEGAALSDDELRLLYVACTRAQLLLDVEAHGWLADQLDGGEAVPA